jgi:hypothetical protein
VNIDLVSVPVTAACRRHRRPTNVNRRSIIREDQADIRVTIDGKSYGDSWNRRRAATSTPTPRRPVPAAWARRSVGGPASRGDLTVGINMSDIVATWHPELESKVGTAR